MKEKLTNTAIILVVALVVVSVGATMIWGWFWVVALITLTGVGITLISIGVLHGYEHYTDIQIKRNTHIQRRDSLDITSNRVPTGTGVSVQRHDTKLVTQDQWGGNDSPFAQILRAGIIGPGKPIVVGYDDKGDAVTTKEPRTKGIGGVQGAGKTVSTLGSVLSEIVYTNGEVRYIICDKHMNGGTDESLVERLDPLYEFFLDIDEVRAGVQPTNTAYLSHLSRMTKNNPVPGGRELLDWVKVLRFEFEERLNGKKGRPWVLIIDEFSAIMKDKTVAPQVADMLEVLGEEGRKFGLTITLIGQVWKATRTGGTEVRDVLPEFIAHRMPENWAKLVVPSSSVRKVPTLADGVALVYNNGVEHLTNMLFVTREDAVMVASMYSTFHNQPTVEIEEVWEPLEIEQTSRRSS